MSHHSHVTDNAIGYFPTINAPVASMSAVHEVLVWSTEMMETLHLQSIVCVSDQAMYAKAAETTWEEPDKFNKVVLRMGAFHTTCCLLSIIGT